MAVSNKQVKGILKEAMLTKGFTLERLQTLILLSESDSIIAAAGRDEKRASTFSRQVGELEKFFGCKLLEDQGRKRVLNSQGRELAGIARDFVRNLDRFSRRLQERDLELHIGAGESLLHWIVIPALAEMRKEAPDFSFQLANLQNHEIVAGLREHSLDFGLLRGEAVHEQLDSVLLGRVEYSLAVPRELVGAREELDWVTVIRELPLAMHLEYTYVQREFDAAIAAENLQPDVRLRFDTFPSALVALQSGKYATFMIRFDGLDTLPHDVVRVDLPCLDHTAREVHLAWSPRMLETTAEIEHVRRDLVEALGWGVG